MFVPFALCLLTRSYHQVLRKGKKVASVMGAGEDKLRKMVDKHCVAQDSNGDQVAKKTK